MNLPRRLLLPCAVLLAAAQPGRGQATSETPDTAPLNVLILAADDLGVELGAYGSGLVSTPHIDRFADSAVVFEAAWVTQASCSPSRSSLFTGFFPHANGQVGLASTSSLHDSMLPYILPNRLRAAGYRTGLLGKLHVAPRAAFEWDYRPEVQNGRDGPLMAALTSRFWESVGAEPWFLMVSFADPHASFGEECRECGFPPQVEGRPEDPILPGAGTILPFQAVDSPVQRRRTANYLNSVSRLDSAVGLILAELEARGSAGNTLVIFLGDHGPAFDRAKLTTYEAGLHVPLIVRWPGVTATGRTSALASTVDLFPTILDAVGLPLPEGLHGRSLRPILSGTAAEWRAHVFGEFTLHHIGSFFPRRAVRANRYKLIHNLMAGRAKPHVGVDRDRGFEASRSSAYRGTGIASAFQTFADPPQFELYDLESDPHEMVNLAADPAFANELGALKTVLDGWRRETADPLLDPAVVDEMARRFRVPIARRPGVRLAAYSILVLLGLLMIRTLIPRRYFQSS